MVGHTRELQKKKKNYDGWPAKDQTWRKIQKIMKVSSTSTEHAVNEVSESTSGKEEEREIIIIDWYTYALNCNRELTN